MFEKTLVIAGNVDLTSAKFTQRDLWVRGPRPWTPSWCEGKVEFAPYPYLLVERFPMMTLNSKKH